jgi:cell division septum initiation protein DivIVA
MSVFIEDIEDAATPAETIAKAIKTEARQEFSRRRILALETARKIWENADATPAEILAALGTDAKELFQAHSLEVQTLAEKDSSIVAEIMAIIGSNQFTYHDDGTVTLS